jgi:ribonuclease R
MKATKDNVIEHVSKVAYRPLRPKELADALGVGKGDYGEFRRLIRRMVGDGDLVRLRGGRIGPPGRLNIVRGTLQMLLTGAAFVIVEDDDDLYIPAEGIGVALPGDTVLARVESEVRRRGSVTRVLKRAKQRHVGTFHRSRSYAFVRPRDERIGRDFFVPRDCSGGAEPGQLVVAELDRWHDPYRNPTAKIVEVLGYPDDANVDVLSVIHRFELPTEFPAEVLGEAESAPSSIPDAEVSRRRDLRRLDVIVIDPSDAKDHDDGVSVEKTKAGWRVGVHIADVSHFVPEGSALDGEAALRGCSVYLVDRVLPMLPERLSGDLCSLREGEDRLAMSCIMDVSTDGRVTSAKVVESVVRSRANLSYDDVQALFDGKPSPKAEPHAEPLREMKKVADVLNARRVERGSLDFDLPEARILLGPQGQVLEAGIRVRLDSHRLIEECMLAANCAVAMRLVSAGVPALFRVHDRPAPDRIERLAGTLGEFDIRIKTQRGITPKQVQRILAKAEGTPAGPFINQIVLRAMARAEYSPKNIGHFGLAFDHYVHFTSPIRRYPDLIVHRILRELVSGRLGAKRQLHWRDALPGIGRLSSERERVAEEAERESVRVKQVQFIATRLGDEYAGVVSGTVSRGFFVTLDELLIEGFVAIEDIGDDFYRLDEAGHRLVGRRTGRAFRLGDPVKVQVVRADTSTGRVDLRIVGGGKPPRRGKRSGR